MATNDSSNPATDKNDTITALLGLTHLPAVAEAIQYQVVVGMTS